MESNEKVKQVRLCALEGSDAAGGVGADSPPTTVGPAARTGAVEFSVSFYRTYRGPLLPPHRNFDLSMESSPASSK